MKRAIKLIGTDAALAVFMASFRFRKSGSLVSFPSDPLIDEEVKGFLTQDYYERLFL
jgi:hypothetical protein